MRCWKGLTVIIPVRCRADAKGDFASVCRRRITAMRGISVQTLAFGNRRSIRCDCLDFATRKRLPPKRFAHVCCEISGRYGFEGAGRYVLHRCQSRPYYITADGKLNIIDYKTDARTKKKLPPAINPQLPIEALIAQNGGFSHPRGGTGRFAALLAAGPEEICVDEKIDQILEHNLANIKTLVAVFDNRTNLHHPNRESEIRAGLLRLKHCRAFRKDGELPTTMAKNNDDLIARGRAELRPPRHRSAAKKPPTRLIRSGINAGRNRQNQSPVRTSSYGCCFQAQRRQTVRLTYTKAAAVEMNTRVSQNSAAGRVTDDGSLENELVKL